LGQRAAIYCRVSTADQSCARQERDLAAFAARAGYDVGIFKETGSGAKTDRVERKKVMTLAQARQIDVVLVAELSRWGRSTLDLLHTLTELEASSRVGHRDERPRLRSDDATWAHDSDYHRRNSRLRA
jgi:putative DNA-invertase from lambdoid prophage Rac